MSIILMHIIHAASASARGFPESGGTSVKIGMVCTSPSSNAVRVLQSLHRQQSGGADDTMRILVTGAAGR
ncbi:MAG: hypothetical protein K8J31_11900, partial [Anaerolineae bacterium]|nr:hypothetical protein [Anaerolineae bacterium]